MPKQQKPILACVHRPNSVLGAVGLALEKQGFALERYFFSKNENKNLENYHAVVLFGGPQSANDDDEDMRSELALAEKAMARQMPLLGICLGAQVIARVIGGQVAEHKQGKVEAGFYPITPTEAGKKLFPNKFFAYHWHKEGIGLPKDAIVLASNETFPVQAFQTASNQNAYGLQFHPEIQAPIIARWLARDRKEEGRLRQPNAKPAWRHFPDYARYGRAQKKWLDNFIQLWLDKK